MLRCPFIVRKKSKEEEHNEACKELIRMKTKYNKAYKKYLTLQVACADAHEAMKKVGKAFAKVSKKVEITRDLNTFKQGEN